MPDQEQPASPVFPQFRMGRRESLRTAGALAVAAMVGDQLIWMTPVEAATAGAGFRSLTVGEGALLRAVCDSLVPGAAEAGVVHFVDHHLSVPYADSLLLARYLNVAPPYLDFYRAGLAAIEVHARRGDSVFADLAAAQRLELLSRRNIYN